jgi:UDP-N-acetylmuramoyl-L-alanyl-D-glutamate--2,6-diaminopimelate ligase
VTATLSAVAGGLRRAERHGSDVEVVDATHDSRQVAPGWLFCAIPGVREDGHRHAPDAVAAGAAALLVERWLDLPVPQVRVPSVRAAVGQAAAIVHGRPSERLTVVGVTGTNGKTSITYLLEAAFGAAALGTGTIGTIEARIHGAPQPGVRTTPEGTDLQRLFHEMADRGVEAVAMEVSSHGLDLRRVDGTRFRVAVFTNLSQDHLDWHGSMEAYFAAKQRLFTPALSERGVVHRDGPWAELLLERATIPVTTVGRDDAADVRIDNEVLRVDGGSATLHWAGAEHDLHTRLPGAFNLTNAALSVVAAVSAGVPIDAALAGVAAASGAPGRFERVLADHPVTVLVDYAHTPDAVQVAVEALRSLVDGGRVLLVLGAGGDRDTGKRGPMGAAAVAADVVVFTSDNPRGEDPATIVQALVDGARQAVAQGAGGEFRVELDRRAAIGAAIADARPGDVVLIAGKGHERIQELADRTVAFDDREVAAAFLAQTGGDA